MSFSVGLEIVIRQLIAANTLKTTCSRAMFYDVITLEGGYRIAYRTSWGYGGGFIPGGHHDVCTIRS